MKKKLLVICLIVLVGCHNNINLEDNVHNELFEYCEKLNCEVERTVFTKKIEKVGYYTLNIVKYNRGEEMVVAYQNISEDERYKGFMAIEYINLQKSEKIIPNLIEENSSDKNYYIGITLGDYTEILYNNELLEMDKERFTFNNKEITVTFWTLSLNEHELIDNEKLIYN